MKYIAISILILILGLLGLLSPLRDGVVSLLLPVQFGLRRTAINLKTGLDFFSDVNKVRDENISLLKKVRDLEGQLVDFKLVTNENILLKQQLSLKDLIGDGYKFTEASILEQSEGTIFINKGTRDSVRLGDMVVMGNYAVGTIRTTDYSRSTVELITSPNLSFTAYDLDSADKTQGLAKGQYSSTLSLERILPNEKINIGDTIVTSGKDGIFLPNYIVGKIIEIQNDPLQPLKKATIQASVDFLKLTTVFIVGKAN